MLEGVKWYDDLTDHGREVMELLKDKEMWKGYIQPMGLPVHISKNDQAGSPETIAFAGDGIVWRPDCLIEVSHDWSAYETVKMLSWSRCSTEPAKSYKKRLCRQCMRSALRAT